MIQNIGLAVLAVVTLGVVVFALTAPPSAQPSASEQVRNYTPPTQEPVKVVPVAVIGDSYSAGTGAGDKSQSWVGRLAFNQAWNVTNAARGGTGYVRSVSADALKACGLDYCPSYPEMINDVVAANPEIVIVAGGRNDSRYPEADEAAAIQSFYEKLQAALPSAKIVAFNAWWDSTAPPASIPAMSAAIKSSVESVGGTYIDAGQPLGSRPELITTDGVHPNPAGHKALFEAALAKLQAAGLATS